MADLLKLSGVSALRRLNKAATAEFFGVSVPALDGWIRRGCPVVKRGSRGEPYELDILAVAEWRFSRNAPGDLADPDTLSPTDRKAWYESEKTRRALQVADRELIPYAEVERVFATAWAVIAQTLLSLPDELERRHGVSGEVAAVVDGAIAVAMGDIADRLESLELPPADESEEEAHG